MASIPSSGTASNPSRGDVVLSAEGDAFLQELLLAHKTRTLGLPDSTTFEPLRPVAINVPLDSDEYFATHTVYQVPVDGELHVRPGQALGSGEPLVDIVHRFAVKRRTGAPLSDRLTAWAMHKERLGKEAEGRLGITPAGKGSDAGVQKTNVGGFQSFHDLFVEDSDDDSDDDDEGGVGEPEWLRSSKADCLLVHRMVSAAVDETGCEAYPGEVAAHRPPPGSLHACYAWLNVNRSADSNFMHTHQVDLWSAVFYVSEGEPNAPGFPSPNGGHMVFRAGPRDKAEGGPALAAADGAPCRSYMQVPPCPGTLWLFPGSMPHLVMRRTLPPGLEEPDTPRVSLGVNFDFATPPLPAPWRSPEGLVADVVAARARAQLARRDEEEAGAAAGQRGAEGQLAAPTIAPAVPAAPAAPAASAPLPESSPSAAAAEVVQRVVSTGDAAQGVSSGLSASHTQLLMDAEESRLRGFSPDEEVVMPMPVWSDSDED